MAKKDLHVVPHKQGWAVRKAGAKKASSVHTSQASAVAAARKLAQTQNAGLVVHTSSGAIRSFASFGNKSQPPRGKKSSRTIISSKGRSTSGGYMIRRSDTGGTYSKRTGKRGGRGTSSGGPRHQ